MTKTVVVLGGGLSGLSAAHTALDAGHRVVLLERQAFMGGNSTRATSGINGGGTRTQAKMGVKDSKAAFIEDTIRGATNVKKGPCPPAYPLGSILAGNSADGVHWLQDKFGLGLDTVSRLGGHSFPRTHRTKAGTVFPGMEITYKLMTKFEEICSKEPHRAALHNKARVNKLEKDHSGRVVAAHYIDKEGQPVRVEGNAFVIATGGYGAGGLFETSTLHQYRPELTHLPTTNGEHCTGDGIKIAMDIGANAVDLKHVQVHPTGLVNLSDPHNRTKFLAAEALRGEGAIILDRDGQRFCNDIGTRDYVTTNMWRHNKAPYRLVLSPNASKNIAWHCKHYVGRNVMKKCSGSQLASDMGLSDSQLQASFDDYNRAAATKNDKFGKIYFDGTPYNVKDDFFVAVITPVVHYTMGGLNITEKAEVIDKASNLPIPGLYAAGEATGGVHLKNRLGGSALLECVVFGRVAGEFASKFVAAGMPLPQGSPSATRDYTIPGEVTNKPTVSDAFKYPATGKPGPPLKIKKNAVAATAGGKAKKKAASGSATYTMAEVAKHTDEEDAWVAVNGLVLNVSPFLDDHPGGKMALMTFAGKDATEEFNMVHAPDVIEKYAKHLIIGKLAAGGSKL